MDDAILDELSDLYERDTEAAEAQLVQKLTAWTSQDREAVNRLASVAQADDTRSQAAVHCLSRLAESPGPMQTAAVTALLGYLNNQTAPAVLSEAIIGIGRSGGEAAASTLTMAEHADAKVRTSVAIVAATLFFESAEQRERVVELLVALAGDENSSVREWAIHGLASIRAFGEYDDPRVDVALVAALSDPSDQVRREAEEGSQF